MQDVRLKRNLVTQRDLVQVRYKRSFLAYVLVYQFVDIDSK